MNPRRLGLLELHAAVLLFGLAGLFGKLLTLPPLVIVFARAAFAAAALGVFARLTPRSALGTVPRGRPLAWLAAGGLLLAFHWVAFFQSIQVSTVAIGVLSFSSFPLFTTFLEPVCFRERLRGTSVWTAAGVLLGVWLMVPAFDFHHAATLGVCWGALSGLSFAVLSLLNRRLVRTQAPLLIAGAQNLVAALALAPLLPALRAPLTSRELFWLAVLGIGCTALSHTLFVRSLAQVRAQTASVVTGLEAVYAVIFAWLLLGEAPSARTLLGGAVILGTTALATLARDR